MQGCIDYLRLEKDKAPYLLWRTFTMEQRSSSTRKRRTASPRQTDGRFCKST